VKRVVTALALAFLLAGSLVEAQRGFRGGGAWGEYGAPPRFPSDRDFDGTFHFCRLMYQQVRRQQRGMGWGTDYPYADINFSIRLSELTKTRVGQAEGGPNHLVVRPTDPALFQCPFVLASDPGSTGFSSADAAGLREYLTKGGFLWVDDFWGPWALEEFLNEIGKALPPAQYPVRVLTPDHPIYRTLFPITAIPQVPSIQFWRQSGGETSEMGEYSATAEMLAIVDQHDRVMVLMTHNTDISDSWEREGEDPQFFFNFSPNGYAVGLNSVLYAMTH
jgi:hypothetical protein